MTYEEARAIVVEALDSVSGADRPFESYLHAVVNKARELEHQTEDPLETCGGLCGRQLKASELGVDKWCVTCLSRLFAEREMSVADFRKIPLQEK